MNKRIQKRVQRKNIRVFVEQPTPQTGAKRPFESLRDVIGIVSAGAGIFATLLYLAGRSFASGYFGAMNIPSYHVSFSIWEYGEVAWMPMLIYPSIIFGGSAFIGWVISSVWEWLTSQFSFFSKWAKDNRTLKNDKLKESQKWLLVFLLSALMLLIIPIISGTLSFVNKWGELAGLLNITRNSAEVDFVSKAPLKMQNSTLNQDTYYYEKYYLLTFNNGKYYVFKDINQVTCEPVQISVINEDDLLQIDIREPVSFEDQCLKKLPTNFFDVLKFVLSAK